MTVMVKSFMRALALSLACVGMSEGSAVAMAGIATPTAPDPGYSMVDDTFVTNGLVQTVVRSGDTIYIGGRFDRVGPRSGPGVELALDGSQNPDIPEISGGAATVLVARSDGAGGWYVGGQFTHVGGVARNNIAHILADHSVDPAFNPDANDSVHALAFSGSTVYVAGTFTSIGGQSRSRIAGLDSANGAATAFDPDADAAVETLAVSDSGSIVYAGGRFASIGGQSRKAIAALNAVDGTATETFDPNPNNALVLALAVSGSTLYVGGYFTEIGGQIRNNLAAFTIGGEADGTLTGFDPNATSGTCAACGGVLSIAVPSSGTTVYAAGMFKNIGGQVRNYLAGLDPVSGAPTSFDPQANRSISTLAVSGSDATLYVAGSFTMIAGEPRNFLAEIDVANSTATAFDPDPNAVALAFGVSDSAVYVGGAFTSFGGVVRRSIAAFNAIDGTVTDFDPNASFGANMGLVNALAVSDATVYAGGFFNSIGGQAREYIAALNASDGSATDWNPGAGGTVEALALADSIIYVGGGFLSIGGQTRYNIAALNLLDGTPTEFDPSANSLVQAIAVGKRVVYIGGFFTTIGGQTRNKIAAINPNGSLTDWDPDPTDSANVLALAVDGETIYAGGNFVTIGGQPRSNIAALDATDGMATDFSPDADGGVYDVAVSGSTVYAAGAFTAIGGQPRSLVAGLDATTGLATDFDPSGSPGFIANALAVAADGTLYIGGSFRGFELAAQQGFASFFGQPVAFVDPPSLSIALAAGETGSAALAIANIGGGALTYDIADTDDDCTAPADVPWLSATPASGSVGGGGSESVSVAADATTLDPGEYSALLCIATNDAGNPLIQIPVSLAVDESDIIFKDGFDAS